MRLFAKIMACAIFGACTVGEGARSSAAPCRLPFPSARWGGRGCDNARGYRQFAIRGGADEGSDEDSDRADVEENDKGAQYVPGMMQQEVSLQ